MNPHIKLLLESAPFTTISTEGRLFTQQDVARFAEALVRECANACLSATEPGSSVHLVSVAYADAVKKHFGVE
jgi:hypothetical protein